MSRIYIHQGHSEADSGAVGADGYQESDFTKAVGEKLAARLTAAGHDACLSRERLPEAKSGRVAADANEVGADVVVSIHANDAGPTARGAEVFIVEGSRRARILADACEAAFRAEFPDHRWRGIKPDTETAAGRLTILRDTQAPAFLIEPGFMSNPDELAWLERDDVQDRIAGVLFTAVTQRIT